MFLAGNTATYSMIIVSMLLVGFGIGFVWPNNNLWTLELASNQARGQVMGILTTCVFVGQFISPMAVDPVLQKLGQSGLFSFAGMAFGAMAVFFLVRHYQSVAKG